MISTFVRVNGNAANGIRYISLLQLQLWKLNSYWEIFIKLHHIFKLIFIWSYTIKILACDIIIMQYYYYTILLLEYSDFNVLIFNCAVSLRWIFTSRTWICGDKKKSSKDSTQRTTRLEWGKVTWPLSEYRALKSATSLNALNVHISCVNAYFNECFIHELLPVNNLPTWISIL